MKYILGFCCLLGLLSFRFPHNSTVSEQMADMSGRDTIYSISVRDIDGVPVDLENFRGKKILLVVLPVSSEDTSVTLAELNALQSKYHDSLIVIGVLAEEFQRDVNDRDFDVALNLVFENKAAHDKYQEHPRHTKFIEENRDTWAKVRVFDSYIKTSGSSGN